MASYPTELIMNRLLIMFVDGRGSMQETGQGVRETRGQSEEVFSVARKDVGPETIDESRESHFLRGKQDFSSNDTMNSGRLS